MDVEQRVEKLTAELVRAKAEQRQAIRDRRRAEAQLRQLKRRWHQEIAERQQAEEALDIENQGRGILVDILEASLNELYLFDAQTLKFEYANQGALKNSGYSLEALRQVTPLHLQTEFTPEEFEQILSPLRQRPQEKAAFQTLHRRADGSCYPVEFHLQFVEYRQQQFFLAIALDVTDRRQVTEQLKQKNAELKAIFEALPDLFFRLDRQGTILDYRAQSLSDTSIAPDSFVGQSLSEKLPPSLGQPLQDALEGVLQTQALASLEYCLPMPLGPEHYELRLLPFQDSQVIAIIRNITERKQAELEIQRLNQRLEQQNRELEVLVEQRTAELLTFINALPDSIFVIDRQQMRVLFCNDTFAAKTGARTRQEMEGKTLFECCLPESATYFAEQNRQVFDSGETLHVQESWNLPAGSLHLDTYKIPLKRPDGEVYALIGSCRDITELVEARQALTARTRQLEAINRELDSFAHSVSHDLRAPLRHVNGFVRALRQELEKGSQLQEPKVAHYLQVIEASSQKMGQLIEGLLALSWVSRKAWVASSVDLRSLVERAIEVTVPPSGQEVAFHIGDLPAVRGDATLLQQVFDNLIGNAVKFSRHRHPAQIEIGASADGTIFVRDNGVGFSREAAGQLFGAFQRLHSQQQFEGHGIGLSIVQRIIHRHGGRIWAESQPGRGATFYFQLGVNSAVELAGDGFHPIPSDATAATIESNLDPATPPSSQP